MTDTLSPFVYWAQTEGTISLKVDLKDVKVRIFPRLCFFGIYLRTFQDPDITLGPDKLKFSAFGHGAKGEHRYAFVLDFNCEVDPEVRNDIERFHDCNLNWFFRGVVIRFTIVRLILF